jgi:ParB-like chromosome segregation protein Spo0J
MSDILSRSPEGGPVPRLERWQVDQVKPHPNHVRKPSQQQRRKLEASFRRFGENAPIMVDRHGFILGGHARFEALKSMGRTDVLVLVLDHLTEAQARGYLIADNKIAEFANWDDGKLALELKGLIEIAEDFEIEDTGFDTGEIDVIIQALDASDPDEHDELQDRLGPPVALLGDLWSLGGHRLLCGDARDAEAYINRASFFSTITVSCAKECELRTSLYL